MKKYFYFLIVTTVVFILSCSNENYDEQTSETIGDSPISENNQVEDVLVTDYTDLKGGQFTYQTDDNAAFQKMNNLIDFNDLIAQAKEDAGIKNLKTARVVYARGIQAYELNGSQWNGRGPLADLYKATIDDVGDLHINFNKRVGTHYLHLSTPAWEFPAGRVIAKGFEVIPGAGPNDIAWLNVALEKPNNFNFKRILRIATIKGKAPKRTDFRQFKRTGSGYETLYVFLK